MDSFIQKGFYTIGALKTNRIIYPFGIRQKVSDFALHLRKTDADVSLVTVGGREFYVYRYEGKLNDIPNAAVILSYPKEAFGNPRALRVFISTNAELSTQEILAICLVSYTYDFRRNWISLSYHNINGKQIL